MSKKRHCLALLFALCLTSAGAQERQQIGDNIVMDNLPQTVHYLGETVSRHMRTANSYSVRGWTHDGDALLFSYRGNLYQSKGPKSKYTELMNFEDISINSALKAEVCGTEGYVFLDDEDGDEYASVYVAASKAVQPDKISTGSARNISLRVSNQQRLVSYASAEKGTGVWRLYVQPACRGSQPQQLYSGASPTYPKDFHPNDGHLLSTAPTADDFKLSEWDLETGSERVLVTADEKISQAVYSADGRYVFYTTNALSEFIELYRLDRSTGESISVLADIGLDIQAIALSTDRQKMAVRLNRAGFSTILVIDSVNLKLLVPPPKRSPGVVSAMYFSPDGDRLAIRLSQPTVPSRSGLYDYRKGHFEPWTGGFVPGQEVIDLVPEATTYSSFDKDQNGKQRQIPVLVYRPSNASPERPVAVAILPHGGPESQSQPSFNRLYHYYVTELGIAVIRPNIRGSTGYGKTFELLDEAVKREDAVRDIGALLDWIDEQPELDSSRVAIAGGSYGGYVVLASLAAYPERFRGGISRFGITDFATFLKNTEPYRVDNRRREYGDERDPEIARFFERISPMRNADKIKGPVLIIQGGNDPRVPQQQAEDMIVAMRAGGAEVSYLLAKDEGHGFKKSRNKRFNDGAQVAFLRRVLQLDD